VPTVERHSSRARFAAPALFLAFVVFAIALAALRPHAAAVSQSWTGSTVGTSVAFVEDTAESDGRVSRRLIEQKLIEIGDDTARFQERTVRIDSWGRQVVEPTRETAILVMSDRPFGGRFDVEGDERIEIAGERRWCHFVRTRNTSDHTTVEWTAWFCDDVPGHVAKMRWVYSGVPVGGEVHVASQTKVAIGWERAKSRVPSPGPSPRASSPPPSRRR
jgi:hypothetical protein